jgi:predicted membrane channel-forming protein YqfA (hemolysin III family)
MICGIHFMFHDFKSLRYIYFGVFAFLSLSAIIFTFVPVFVAEKFAIVRMLIFGTLFIVSFLCSIHWTVIARIEEVEALSKYTLSAYTFIFTGFLFYLSKFPESLCQSRWVDYYFQSHTLWHLCVTGSAVSYYLLLYNYNIILLLQQKIIKP